MSRRFGCGRRNRFPIKAFVAACSALMGLGGGQALASAGCDAVNAGGFTAEADAANTATNLTIAAFAVGDIITFNITIVVGTAHPEWFIGAGSDTSDIASSSVSGTQTYTVTGNLIGGQADTTLSERVFSNFGIGSVTVTATCTPAGSSTGNTDSQKVRALQIAASKLVAQNSGAAISGAIDGAIDDAFGDGGNPVTVGPNGAHFNFAAEPAAASDVVRKAHDSFASALAYAGDPMVTKAPATRVVERSWSAWADVRGTGFDRNTSGADLNGTQLNVTAGLARKLTPDILVGVLGGYENFRYTSDALSGTFKGDGATVGTYAAWRIAPTLRWDAAIAWSRLWYDAAAGTANGSFTGSRFLGSTGLTGRYRMYDFIAEPSVKVFALREHQNAWTDSLGTVQASRDFWAGRVSAGGKLIRPWLVAADTTVSPYVGAYADWYFASDNALPAGQPVVGLADGWSGRVTGGVAVAKRGGGMLSLGGEYGGLGANYKIWTANARALWAF